MSSKSMFPKVDFLYTPKVRNFSASTERDLALVTKYLENGVGFISIIPRTEDHVFVGARKLYENHGLQVECITRNYSNYLDLYIFNPAGLSKIEEKSSVCGCCGVVWATGKSTEFYKAGAHFTHDYWKYPLLVGEKKDRWFFDKMKGSAFYAKDLGEHFIISVHGKISDCSAIRRLDWVKIGEDAIYPDGKISLRQSKFLLNLSILIESGFPWPEPLSGRMGRYDTQKYFIGLENIARGLGLDVETLYETA